MSWTPKQYNDWVVWAETRERSLDSHELPEFRRRSWEITQDLTRPVSSFPKGSNLLTLVARLFSWARKNPDPWNPARVKIVQMHERWDPLWKP